MVLTQVKYEEARKESENVDRIYIKTLQDRVMKPEQQENMIKRWAPSQVYAIGSDHSPFFSNPLVLSGLLLKVATLPTL